MTSWMKQHTQFVLRQMTQNLMNTLMAIWKTLMRPHHKCMRQRVAVFKKHESFCLMSRVPEAIFLLLALVLLAAWFSHSLIESLQSLVAKATKARGKGNPLRRRVESRQTWVHLASCQNHRPHVPSLVLRCPRSVRLRLAQLVVDHITLLVFVLICACCREVGHRASDCPNKRKMTAFSPSKRGFGAYSLRCAVFDAPCYSAIVEETEQDQDENDIEDFVAFSIKSLEEFAGGATKTVLDS